MSYIGSYFFKLVIQIAILVGSPVDAVGVHTTGQTNMKGHALERTPGNGGM